MQGAWDELLAAKTRVDRHYQHIIHDVEHFAQTLHRGSRIDYHTYLGSLNANQLQGTVEVNAGFLVHRDPVRPGGHKFGDVLVRILNHEVAIQRDLGGLAEGSHDGRAYGDIGHKMAVHHIHVE